MPRTLQGLHLGWLDFSGDDERRARDYLAQFNADNTLDELGFGVLRDAFSDVFFPATNTIMTRTRYLVFVAALCLIVEREKLDGRRAAQQLTQLENKLRELLCREESHDVIGAVAKNDLQRYPSSIYWSALRQLEILQHSNWSLSYYLMHLRELHVAASAEKDDDGLSHLDAVVPRHWDNEFRNLISDGHSFMSGTETEWPVSVDFSLTRHEARYLDAKYRALADRQGRPSIISHLLESSHAGRFDYPWDVPNPAKLAVYVRHARFFSMLTQGATLQYWHLLLREFSVRGIGKPAVSVERVFSLWWQATCKELTQWDADVFLDLATSMGAIRRPNDRAFIKTWLKCVIEAADATKLLENPEAHTLIRERERITRPSKGRLRHPDYLKRWKPPEASTLRAMEADPDRIRYGLDYRAWIGSVVVRDILDARVGGR